TITPDLQSPVTRRWSAGRWLFHRKKSSMSKYVYFFGSGKAEGRADMKDLLGGKGANLAEMTNIGLPVPAGFTLTNEVCPYYYEHDHAYPPELKAEVAEAMKKTEAARASNV